jgi:NADH-quinone oxidoreductase subunit A
VSPEPLWPLAVYLAAVVVLVAGMLGLSFLLGQRHAERATGQPYESGVLPTGSAHVRFSAQFYLVAMLFVIFDLEAVFLVAWAVAFRQVGWVGYVGAVAFVGVLGVGLAYEWRMGALDWGTSRLRRAAPPAAVQAREEPVLAAASPRERRAA